MSNSGRDIAVSIITVCLNAGRLIEDTLLSVINQNIPGLEYIIIDGGSTDDTLDIVKKYRKNISILVSEKDRGISDAMNKGITLGHGRIIGIIHAGDAYNPGSIQSAIEALKDEEFGFTFGDCTFTKSGRPVFRVLGDPQYERTIRRRMPSLNHPTVFVKSSVYRDCGLFDEKWHVAMDYELLLRFHARGVKGRYINADIARMDLEGVSKRNYLRSMKEVEEISVQYGYPPVTARFYFYFNALKYGIRITLEKIGLMRLTAFIRRMYTRGYSEV